MSKVDYNTKARKIDKIHEDLEIHQEIHLEMHSNVQIFSLYIFLTWRIDIFRSESIDKFCCGGIETFWPKDHRGKIDKVHKDFWIIPSLHMSQSILIPLNHILPTCTKNNCTTSTRFSHNIAPTLSVLYHFLYSHLLASTNPIIFLDAMLI